MLDIAYLNLLRQNRNGNGLTDTPVRVANSRIRVGKRRTGPTFCFTEREFK